MTAEEILRRRKERLDSKTWPTKSTLSSFWKQRVSLVFGGHQKPVTGKEAGQLKQLQTYLGEDTRAVIDYAVNNWWKFASRAGAEIGQSFPGSPHIGFLLQNYPVAVNMMQPVAKIVVDTPAQPIYDEGAATKESEQPHHLTADELAAMIAGLKE